MATESTRNVNAAHTNPDPITKTPGSHPGATAIGSASGAAAGAAAGALGGPVGAVIGGVVGAAVGGGVGHEAGEVHDPSAGNPSKVDAAVREKANQASSASRTA